MKWKCSCRPPVSVWPGLRPLCEALPGRSGLRLVTWPFPIPVPAIKILILFYYLPGRAARNGETIQKRKRVYTIVDHARPGEGSPSGRIGSGGWKRRDYRAEENAGAGLPRKRRGAIQRFGPAHTHGPERSRPGTVGAVPGLLWREGAFGKS